MVKKFVTKNEKNREILNEQMNLQTSECAIVNQSTSITKFRETKICHEMSDKKDLSAALINDQALDEFSDPKMNLLESFKVPSPDGISPLTDSSTNNHLPSEPLNRAKSTFEAQLIHLYRLQWARMKI